MIQGSPEWVQRRIGRVTASRVADVFAKPRKHAVSLTRESYMADLLAERLTGVPTVRFGGDEAAMAWGTANEQAARDAYKFFGGDDIKEVGFVDHPRIPMSGASPDGVVRTEGMVEIKCPKTETHQETMRLQRVPPKYLPQIKWGLACTGRRWCDFISFDPRLSLDDSFYCQRVEPWASELRAMEMGVIAFLLELEARVAEHQGERASDERGL